MQKPLVFISHITSEKDVAHALRDLIQATFMGMIDVFVSSDPDSIAMGGKWLDQITQGLKTCVIEVVVASPLSIQRPWINFEAGAGWVRDISVIPVCHSGMEPDKLPPPLSNLQSALATDPDQLKRVLAVLAKVLDCQLPDVVDCTKFIGHVNQFESDSRQIERIQPDSLVADKSGLATHEIATLIAAAECTDVPGTSVWPQDLKQRMNEAGYRDIATTVGIASLERKGLIDTQSEPTGNFDECSPKITVNPNGWAWLEGNLDTIALRTSGTESLVPSADIPF